MPEGPNIFLLQTALLLLARSCINASLCKQGSWNGDSLQRCVVFGRSKVLHCWTLVLGSKLCFVETENHWCFSIVLALQLFWRQELRGYNAPIAAQVTFCLEPPLWPDHHAIFLRACIVQGPVPLISLQHTRHCTPIKWSKESISKVVVFHDLLWVVPVQLSQHVLQEFEVLLLK